MLLTKLERLELFGQISWQTCFLSFFVERYFRVESCIKVAIHVRGGVLKFTSVVDDDTTVHDVHTNTVSFSLSVLIKCSICLHQQTLTLTP